MLAATTPTALPRGRGTVFLLHVHQASGQVGHFVGCAVDVQAHLERLRAGGGPPLIRAAVAAGVDLELVCTWSGGRAEPLGNPLVDSRSCRICRAARR